MIPQDQIPHILKYMGGKRDLLDEIGKAIDEMNVNTADFCDLFAGTSIVSYAFSDSFNVVSNDIQSYSSVFSNTYFSDFSAFGSPEIVVNTIMEKAETFFCQMKRNYPQLCYHYSEDIDFNKMLELELEQLRLVNSAIKGGFSFFIKYYSGTYWSFEQCAWIDSIRAVAETYKGTRLYYAILSALVFAMSYCAQSTGHFAQFRTLTINNYKSVLLYRMKSVPTLFQKKMLELLSTLRKPLHHSFRSSTLNYEDCVSTLRPNTVIYADPPYSAVHYSRFYHVLETLVLYDHPRLEYKGRYRENRYQSPFDQRRHVTNAFESLFHAVRHQKCHLLLSYCDNALLAENQLDEIASRCLGTDYEKHRYFKEYKHMKMGRTDESNMDVYELLMAYTKI